MLYVWFSWNTTVGPTCVIAIIFYLKIAVVLHLIEFVFTLHEHDVLYQVWLKLVQSLWRGRREKFLIVSFYRSLLFLWNEYVN